MSIEMVIWVTVGGRGTLIGPIIGAVLVNYLRSLVSEALPEAWLFVQGGLFIFVVVLMPDGVTDGLKTVVSNPCWQRLTSKKSATYPKLDMDEGYAAES